MSLVGKVLPRRHHRQCADRPIWWEETPAGPLVFDRSLRTAAEILGPHQGASAPGHRRLDGLAGSDDPPDDDLCD